MACCGVGMGMCGRRVLSRAAKIWGGGAGPINEVDGCRLNVGEGLKFWDK